MRADERLACPDYRLATVLFLEAVVVRLAQDHVGELATGVVLLLQHLYQIGERVLLLERGEDEVFFELLVVILHEVPHQHGGRAKQFRRDVLLRADSAQTLLVDQQYAVEDAMFAHQIFGCPDFLIVLFLADWLGRNKSGRSGCESHCR